MRARIAINPEKSFLFSEIDGREWTYSEFDSAVNHTANMLISNGIGRGDVVSLLLPNSAEYVIAYFACWKIGAIAGPINSLLKQEEIEWVIGNSESKLILSEPSALADGHLRGLGNNIPIITNCPPADAGGSDQLDGADIGADDDAVIIYTSGTTGKPKGCILTHGNLIANARQIVEWMNFGADDRLLTVMPLFHMNAVSVTTLSALYAGGSTVVSPKFSASRFWDIIEKYQITSFGSVATMLSMLLQKNSESGIQNSEINPKSKIKNQKSESLRFAMCGSAPVPAEVLHKFEGTFGVLVIEGYGLSESTCRSTFNPPNEARRPGSCGKPIGNEIKIFDENDNELPYGEMGEIVLRGPNIFKGYFKNSAATEKAFASGWFHTGDIGYRDADFFFYIADRKSDMIIRGGENIYPREIDDLLYTHPAVAAAAVVGVPDDLYGEEVAAFIVLKDKQTTSKEEIIDFCAQHLADYKCPNSVHFVEDIPKGPTGKLLKRELAKLFKEACV
ncbi:MAG: class I adenylate-forming enzyme family protein [Blastocatellia bacterium]